MAVHFAAVFLLLMLVKGWTSCMTATHGYNKDKPRMHAWSYGDHVVRAWNQDKPYSRFVQEQIAGDALAADMVDGIVTTGLIAAGP